MTVFDRGFACGQGDHGEHLDRAAALVPLVVDAVWLEGAYDGRQLIPQYGAHVAAGAVSLASRTGTVVRCGWLAYPDVTCHGRTTPNTREGLRGG